MELLKDDSYITCYLYLQTWGSWFENFLFNFFMVPPVSGLHWLRNTKQHSAYSPLAWVSNKRWSVFNLNCITKCYHHLSVLSIKRNIQLCACDTLSSWKELEHWYRKCTAYTWRDACNTEGLQQGAFGCIPLSHKMSLQHCNPYSFIKDQLHVLLCDDRAFYVFDCTNFLLQLKSLDIEGGVAFPCPQLLNFLLILPEVQLCPNKNDRDVWTKIIHLRKPLSEQWWD